MKNRIPKTIHYCWFGGNEKDPLTIKCIESWKKYCPDYEIIEWNETNFDLNTNKYVQQAYDLKKWAFVSDYVRLEVVYNIGGIYLDCDVEIIKNISELHDYSAFFGFEDDNWIATGLGFGAEKGNIFVKALMDDYANIEFQQKDGTIDMMPCPIRNSTTLEKMGVKLNNTFQIINETVFLTKDFLCPLNYQTGVLNVTANTYSIHHYNASWLPLHTKFKLSLKKYLRRIIGEKVFERVKELRNK